MHVRLVSSCIPRCPNYMNNFVSLTRSYFRNIISVVLALLIVFINQPQRLFIYMRATILDQKIKFVSVQECHITNVIAIIPASQLHFQYER